MKSYIVLFALISIMGMSVQQSFAGWLISPSGKLTSEDKVQLELLQKYQEPLIKKTGTKIPTKPTTTTPVTTSNAALQKQLDTLFKTLQSKIATKSIVAQNSVYTTLISRIKNIQAKNTNLSAKNTFILEYLLEKSTAALKTVQVPTGTGTTIPTSTGSSLLGGDKTIGNITFAPATFSNTTSTGVILGEFSVSQDTTLHHLDITIKSDTPINFTEITRKVMMIKSNGLGVANSTTYTYINANTVQIGFDSAFLLRVGNYSLTADFVDNKNTYYQTFIDSVQTTKGTINFTSGEYLLGKTTITK